MNGQNGRTGMQVPVEKDLDFLAARLHGWRSRLAEGDRLDELCRIRTVGELARRVTPGLAFRHAVHFQRHLIEAHVRELAQLAARVDGAGGAFLCWQRVRFQAENLKVIARGLANRLPLDSVTPHLAVLPGDLALDLAPFAEPGGAPLLDRLLRMLPPGALRRALEEAGDRFREATEPFLAETALDRAYLQILLRRAAAVGGEDGAGVVRLARHEAGIFNLMLVIRGGRHYHLPPELLHAACVPGGSLGGEDFDRLLSAEDAESGIRVLARQLDPAGAAGPSPEAPVLEALAWNRFLKLANTLFRRSQMSVGVAIGFAAIRRIELANLITLSEGMRMGLDPQRIRQRLIPRAVLEVAHV